MVLLMFKIGTRCPGHFILMKEHWYQL